MADRTEECVSKFAFELISEHLSKVWSAHKEEVENKLIFIASERVFVLHTEGGLEYPVAPECSLSHKSDMMLDVHTSGPLFTPVLNVEIKFRSSVTDAFKARAYDQIHLKKAYPFLVGILVYIKPRRGGISFEQAKNISYPFDAFVFINEGKVEEREEWDTLLKLFDGRIQAVSKDNRIPDVACIEKT